MPYFIKRILTAIPLLLGITLISFVLMKAAPGDPVSMYMDPNMSIQDVQQIRENLGLDKPVIVQYVYWLKNALIGDFGYSNITGKPVFSAIFERLPATLLLSIASLVFIFFISIPIGLLSGANKGSFFDQCMTFFSFLGYALPTFWLGLMLILVFSLKLGWFPTAGFLDPRFSDSSLMIKVADIIRHMVLPLSTIVIGGVAGLIRYNRFGIIKILNEDYVKAASARGLSNHRILFKHAFKNAALPMITILGLQLPALVGGSFVIEYIFSWPGMGQLGVNAVFSRDYPILMGTLLLTSALIILGNLLADIAYRYVDPRIRLK